MKPSIKSKSVVFPTKGRLWLPPDCETTEALFGKLWMYHKAEASSVHLGEDHVAKHKRLQDQAADGLTYFINST
jgi:hypothetical protein